MWYIKPCYFIFLFLIANSVQAQQKVSTLTVHGDFVNISLLEFVELVGNEHQISFYYQPEELESIQVNHSFKKNTPLTSALEVILETSNLSFLIILDNAVVFIPKSGKMDFRFDAGTNSDILEIGDPLNRGRTNRALLSGKVIDGKNGEPFIGAVVYLAETNEGATTGKNGEFEIELPVGIHELMISYMGYIDRYKKIDLIEDGTLTIELFEESHTIDEVTVVGQSRYVSRSQMSINKISSKEIKSLPVLVGEPDVIKSIVLMPGIQSVGELSAGFNVRGGNTDQNLVLMNGAPVYNTSHLFGFFSMINPDAISDAIIYKGGMPSRFGGRVSSVMDITLNEGNQDHLKLQGGLGLINSRVTLEGPLTRNKKITFLLGARSTYSDWLLKQIKNTQFDNSSASFYDMNATLNIKLGQNSTLEMMGYYSEDDFNFGANDFYNYSNSIASINWDHNFGPNVIGHWVITYSKYDFNYIDSDEFFKQYDYHLFTGIENVGTNYTLSAHAGDIYSMQLGGQAKGYVISPGEVTPVNDNSSIVNEQVANERALEISSFINNDFDFSANLTATAGLRFSNFYTLGEATEYIYNENQSKRADNIVDSLFFPKNSVIKRFYGLEPRLSLKYGLNEAASLRWSYQRVHQYLRQISNTSVVSPADYWKACDYHIDPLISDQIALGYFRDFKGKSIEASAEIYYKKLKNLVDYKNGAKLVMNHTIETDVIKAHGYAYGLELYIKKSKGRLNGWLSYTYSRAMQQTNNRFKEESINNDRVYPSVYDKPHDLSLVANYQISRRWRLSGNFVFFSGRPTTLPEQKYRYKGREMVYYSDRNKYRMPSYHRFDISITLDENLKKKRMWKGSWTFSIYNLYGRNNPYSVYFLRESSQNGNADMFTLFKYSVIGVPFPSLTYNFSF